MRSALKKECFIKSNSRKYIVKKTLGEGATGITYLCYAEENKHLNFAVKELYPRELEYELSRDNDGCFNYSVLKDNKTKSKFEWYKENFKNEFDITNTISNIRQKENNDPYFLNPVEIFEYNNTLYSVLETKEGLTLLDYLNQFNCQEHLSTEDYRNHIVELLEILIIATKKLKFIHKRYLHLDITPHNIYLINSGSGFLNNSNGVPFFLDFGSALPLGYTYGHKFSVSDGFSAPEVILKSKGGGEGYFINQTADMYSLVAILYYGVTGQILTYPLKSNAVLNENLLLYPEEIRVDLRDVFEKGLGEPSKRYNAADELAKTFLKMRAKITNGNNDIIELLSHIDDFLKLPFAEIKESLDKNKKEILNNSSKQVRILKKHIYIAMTSIIAAVILLCGVFVIWHPWNLTKEENVSENSIVDTTIPTISLSKPIFEKGTILFTVYGDDETDLENIVIEPQDISTYGFVADISIIGNGATKLIELKNFKNVSGDCSIAIKSGVITDASGNKSKEVSSSNFGIDISQPIMSIGIANPQKVKIGDSVTYSVATNDNIGVTYFSLHKDDIEMIGFTADISIEKKSTFVREISFSNIKSTSNDKHKYFKVLSGVSKDAFENVNKEISSPIFIIE